jgi:hypothetical protein
MNYYESVVIDYLRADRAIFVNTQCCLQLNPSPNPDKSGPHWYCDAVAIDFRPPNGPRVFLCEYGSQLADLLKRLIGWSENWTGVRSALARDCCIPPAWPVRPWLFVPEQLLPVLLKRLGSICDIPSPAFVPRITPLEAVQPWRYCSWNREREDAKPEIIPARMIE